MSAAAWPRRLLLGWRTDLPARSGTAGGAAIRPRRRRGELAGRPSDQIGLVAFAALPEDTCPLTLSHDVLVRLLDAEEPRALPDTGTNIGDALAWSLTKLDAAGDRRQDDRLVSDGEHNVAGARPHATAGRSTGGSAGVPVYTIDAGPPAPSPGQTRRDRGAAGPGRSRWRPLPR